MAARTGLLVTITALIVALGAAVDGLVEGGAAPSRDLVLVPPSHGRIYPAAFPDFGGAEDRVGSDRIHSFERSAGRRIAWAYFSNNWFRGRIRFPGGDVRAVERANRVPFIRMMARSGFGRGPDPNFRLQSIIRGDWDSELERWCDRARQAGGPLLVEFGTEVNGDWFPWNGRWNGAGRTRGYGDPGLADGPERFRDAYRHIVDTCRRRGATNLTWFFHVDVGAEPKRPWNTRFANYYPGDAYVDWIGVSDYGPLRPGERWVSFKRRLDRVYDRISRLSTAKPIAVLEYGAAEQWGEPRRKAQWVRRAIRAVASHRWPRVRGLSYWHERWRNGDGSVSDLHVDSSSRSHRAYRHAVRRRAFTARPRFVARP
jgi:glycosyl hydrolase family 26